MINKFLTLKKQLTTQALSRSVVAMNYSLPRLGTSPIPNSCSMQCLTTLSVCSTRVQTREKNTPLFSCSVSIIMLSTSSMYSNTAPSKGHVSLLEQAVLPDRPLYPQPVLLIPAQQPVD